MEEMSREILFCGKRSDNGEWIRGDLITTPFIRNETQQNIIYILDITKADYDCFEDLTEDNGIFEVEPETVCQYTGLTDKNGTKIFEGDIVKGVAYSTDFVGYIVWIDTIAGFGVRYFNKHREPTAWENSSILKAIQRWKQPNEFQAEIIGNIFDNPELIS